MWLVLEKERERGGVYGHFVLSREVLLPGGKKPLRKEKPADPEHLEMRDRQQDTSRAVVCRASKRRAQMTGTPHVEAHAPVPVPARRKSKGSKP